MSAHEVLAEWSRWIWPHVANHVWQATVFAALIFAATLVVRRGPARTRHALWLLASVKFALPSLALVALAGAAGIDLSSWSANGGALLEPATPAIAIAPATAAPVEGEALRAPAPAGHMDLFGALTVAWLIGSLFVAGACWRRHQRLGRAIRSGEVLRSGRAAEALARAKARAGVTNEVGLIATQFVSGPGVFGAFRCTLALPAGMEDSLSDEDLEMVFLHEMVHVRRRDNLLSILQLLLCSAFWFWPVVWAVRTRLLAERECACDEQAVALCGRPSAYASSLLKVCRLSLAREPAAGLAAFGGSDIRGRIAAIASHGRGQSGCGRQRVTLGVAGLALVAFSILGMLGSADAVARTANHAGASDHPKAAPPAGMSEEVGALLDQAAPIPVRFENSGDAPLVIASAAVRFVALGGSGPSRDEELVGPPEVSLASRSDRRIVGVRLSLQFAPRLGDTVELPVSIEPGASFVLRPDRRQWWNRVPAGSAESIVVRLAGVRYEDDPGWSEIAPPGAEASSARRVDDGAAVVPARFENPAGAPLRIAEASTRVSAARFEPESDDGGDSTRLPVVELVNTTGSRIVAVKLRFKAAAATHAVSVLTVNIQPFGTYVYSSKTVVDGRPEDMRVQVLGVQFEDGSLWGAFDTTISSREETVSVPEYIRRP